MKNYIIFLLLWFLLIVILIDFQLKDAKPKVIYVKENCLQKNKDLLFLSKQELKLFEAQHPDHSKLTIEETQIREHLLINIIDFRLMVKYYEQTKPNNRN